MLRTVFILQFVAMAYVICLEDFAKFRERSCSNVPLTPIKANREFVDSLRYMIAGSRYNVYRGVSQLPNYQSMTEDELKSEVCYVRNTTTTQQGSIGAVFGFDGRVLSTFRVTSKPGIYEETGPPNSPPNTVGLRGIVTLTDHKNFAFIVVCWIEANEAAWTVVTGGPSIDLNTRRVIEQHAVSLGFKRENAVYLTYDRCHWANPILVNNVGWAGPNGPRRLARLTY